MRRPWRVSDPDNPESEGILVLNSLGFVVATHDEEDLTYISGLIQRYKMARFKECMSKYSHFVAILDYGITQDPEFINPSKHSHHAEIWDLLQTEIHDDLRMHTKNIVEVTAIGDETIVYDLIEPRFEIPVPPATITIDNDFAKYLIDKSRPCAHEGCEYRVMSYVKTTRCHNHQTDEEYRAQRV